MPDEVKLLPCPFCGDPLVIEVQTFGHMRDQGHLPEEQRCILRHSAFPIELAAAWNTRAIEATRPTDEVVERRDSERKRVLQAMQLHDGGDNYRLFNAGWDASLAAMKDAASDGGEA